MKILFFLFLYILELVRSEIIGQDFPLPTAFYSDLTLSGSSSIFLDPDNMVNFGNNAFSISFWLKLNQKASSQFAILRLRQDTQFLFAIENGFQGLVGFFAGFRGYNQMLVPYDPSLLEYKWNHFVIIYNGGDKNLASSYEYYINLNKYEGSFNAGIMGGEGAPNDNGLGCNSFESMCFVGEIKQFLLFKEKLSSPNIEFLFQKEALNLIFKSTVK